LRRTTSVCLTTKIPPITPVTAATATSARARPLFTGTRFVDRQSPAIKRFSVQTLNGGVSRFLRFHGDKAETSRPATESVHNHIHFNDISESGKRLLKLIMSGIVGKVPDEQFRIHYDVALTDLPARLFPTPASNRQ
jgi:hypothetical protein